MSKVKPRKTMVLESNNSSKRKKHESHNISNAMPSTKGDGLNIAILLFLYTLQGVPLGLSAAIPITMQKKHITYSEQVELFFIYCKIFCYVNIIGCISDIFRLNLAFLHGPLV